MSDEEDNLAFQGYVLDHIEYFDLLPMEFKTLSGETWNYEKCWEMAAKLDLLKYLSQYKQ